MRIPRWFLLPTLAVTALAGVLCFVPLFDLLAYEFAFALGLLAGVTALVVGLGVGRSRDNGPVAMLLALGLATLHLLPALGLISLNALRVKNCNWVEGLYLFALLPLASAWYGAALGVLTAQLLRRATRFARAFAALAIIGGALALTLWRLYSEPSIVAFDHLFGYFAGSLYDEVIRIDARLVAFRAGTALRLAGIFVILLAGKGAKADAGALHASGGSQRRPLPVIAALVLMIGLCAAYEKVAGNTFGFRVSRADILAALPVTETRPGLVIHLPAGLPPELRTQIADDHAFRLAEAKQRLAVTDLPVVHSYVYRDAAEKAHFMGARATMVAKPWLFEIHVHDPRAPHPVVAHELVHVVAAAFAPPPLRISSRLGVLANMGIVEGLAEALTPPNGELDRDTYTRAMQTLKLAPDMQAIVGPAGFYSAAAGRAYTVAGSFIAYLLETHGPAPLKAAYARGDFEGAYGKPLATLLKEWQAHLDGVPLTPRELALTEEQFKTPAIFARTCAHEVAALRAAATQAAPDDAVRLHERIVANLGDNPTARYDLVMALHRRKRDPSFEAAATALLADKRLTTTQRSELLQARADEAWARGDLAQARALFTEVSALPLSLPTERLQWVRLWALGESRERAEAIGVFLSERVPSVAAVLRLAEERHKTPGDKTLAYLIGRQVARAGECEQARRYLEAAAGHPSAPIEAERLRLIAECEAHTTSKREAAMKAYELYAEKAPSSGERARAVDEIARLRWEQGAAAPQTTAPAGASAETAAPTPNATP